MARLSFMRQTAAADMLLLTETSPRRRLILETYKLHVLLEMCGSLEIMDLLVDDPEYNVLYGGQLVTYRGREQIRDMYQALYESRTYVTVVENQQLAVADWGFASVATYNNFLTGEQIVRAGLGEADSGRYYIRRSSSTVVWPNHDERCRAGGENILVPPHTVSLIEIPAEEFITPEDAREEIEPLAEAARIAYARAVAAIG